MFKIGSLIKAFLLTVFIFILLFGASFAYLVVSPLGGKLLLRYFKQKFTTVGQMHVGYFEGSLHQGITLKNVIIKGLYFFPDAVLRIQEVHVRLPLWDLPHYDLNIFNARIFLPDSDPIVFTGELCAGQIKGDLYAKSVDIHEISQNWTSKDIQKYLRGYLSDVDLTLQGPLNYPRVKGSFLLDGIRYQSVYLSEGISRVDLILSPDAHQFQMKGIVFVDSGTVNVHQKDLELQKSKFVFQGDVMKANLDINLGAKVEDMDFHLTIKGSIDHPQMIVSSDPPMNSEDALNVLFSGNAVAFSTSPFNTSSSSDLAQNFLNYSFQGNNEQQQIGMKTKLTDNLKLGAEMDPMPTAPGETNIYYSRKINGEMDMNDYMSLNISQEVMPQDNYPAQSTQVVRPQADTQIYMQYKKRF